MIKSRLQFVLCGLGLALTSACGAAQKPVHNDEVTVPINAEDEEALSSEPENPNAPSPAQDAGPAPAP
jgi:hypothetical protein